ncbi:MAG: IS110 family transposase [Alphaproteobacteria bacterium]|nr:IS110 family transposase [Alphaproteobacteria bacterium]
MNDQNQRLQSVPGVGPQTACHLMASMPELGQVNRRQIVSLVGLAPHARESGLYKGKRAIHGGRPRVRRAMYMVALVAIWWDSHWKAMAKCATMERLQKQPSSRLLDDFWSVSMQ